MDNKLTEYLIARCKEEGGLCTDSNILRKLLIMDDGTLIRTIEDLYCGKLVNSYDLQD